MPTKEKVNKQSQICRQAIQAGEQSIWLQEQTVAIKQEVYNYYTVENCRFWKQKRV